jgi:nucleotide-binding universal stress UspA family protein
MLGHDPEELFERVLIPIASEDDARMARETILPYLADCGGVATVVHVVKYTEGGVDPSPVSMQEEDAQRLFEIVGEVDDDLVVETRTAYGTDIVEAIFEVADEIDASAVVFSPQKRNRLVRLLTGDTALSLVTDPDVPVLAIPRAEE